MCRCNWICFHIIKCIWAKWGRNNGRTRWTRPNNIFAKLNLEWCIFSIQTIKLGFKILIFMFIISRKHDTKLITLKKMTHLHFHCQIVLSSGKAWLTIKTSLVGQKRTTGRLFDTSGLNAKPSESLRSYKHRNS